MTLDMVVGASAPLASSFWDDCTETTMCRVVDMLVGVEGAEAAEAGAKGSGADDRAALAVLSVKVDLCRALLSHCGDSRTNNIGLADVLDVLAAAFADVNAKNLSEETVLMYSAGCPDAVRALVRLGADATPSDCCGYTALFFAKDREVVDILLAAGADVDARAEDGITPLMHACCHADIEVARALLENGADVNLRDDEGRTVLSVICSECCDFVFAALDLLLRSGADERIADNHGRLPVDLLSERIYAKEVVGQARHLLLSAPRDRAWRRRGFVLMCISRSAGADSGGGLAQWLVHARAGQAGVFRSVVRYL
ncbi:unnamed protein product [Ectocarpus sp. 13 AM-2016]